jgi:acetolactate synthase-1/2/3 large subunit
VEALNAGTPVVALVGNTHRDHAWKNMTQESRQIEILRPACKELIRIEAIQRIPELMRRAFVVATSGRPGPVVVDVPEDSRQRGVRGLRRAVHDEGSTR